MMTGRDHDAGEGAGSKIKEEADDVALFVKRSAKTERLASLLKRGTYGTRRIRRGCLVGT